MTAPFVRALLITDGSSSHLEASLAALLEQEYAPASVEIVIVGGAEPDLTAAPHALVTRIEAASYADALTRAVAALPAREDELVWLLHADTAPAPDALARLVATALKRPRAAIVGAAQVRWRDTSRLVSLGTTVSRWGVRRVGHVVEDDINQGQHDDREDVLAVSLAAALVRREAFDALGGPDAGYRGFGDSLDWCRRAWGRGWDVVIEPRAMVRHAQDSLYGVATGAGKAATHAVRRTSEWHHALAWAPWWKALLLALAIVPSALARTAFRLAQHDARLALAEASVPFRVVARLRDVAATAAHRRALGATLAVEPRLLATTRQVVDSVRHRELGGVERARAARAPSDFVRAELARVAARSRFSLLVTVVAGLAVSAAFGVAWLRGIASGAMVSGPGVGSTDVSLAALWERAWTGWSEAGLGNAGIDGAFAGLLLPLAALPGGLRTGVAIALVVAPALAAVVAWAAAGAATRSPWARVVAALTFACWPPFLAAIHDARLGAVIAHVALAAAAAALARAGGWRRGEIVGGREELAAPGRSASAGLLASLALTAATVAQPVLLLPAMIVVALLGAAAPGARWRLWSVGVVPLVLGLPGLIAAGARLADPAVAAGIVAREPGPGAGFEGHAWQVAAGIADSSRWHETFAQAAPLGVVASLVLLASAVAGLAQARAWRAAAAGLAIAGLGAAVAGWSASVVVSWPDGAGAPAQHGWPGAGASLVALGLIMAATAAHGALQVGLERKDAAGRIVATAAAAAVMAATAATTLFVAWPGAPRGSAVQTDVHVLPLAVPLEQEGAATARTLVLDATDDGVVTFAVLATDGATYVAGRADRGPDGSPLAGGGAQDIDVLADDVGALVTTGAASTESFVEWGISTIVVAPGDDRIRAALDQNGGVSLVGGSERGAAYRIVTAAASRAWITAGDERVSLDSTATSGHTDAPPAAGGTLVVAVPADSRWHAEADGRTLPTVADPLGRVAFTVPAGAEEVTYGYRDPAQRWWWWASAIALAWAAVGALPLRGAREVS